MADMFSSDYVHSYLFRDVDWEGRRSYSLKHRQA